jgi:catalase
MHGFGSHTFSLYNEEGERVWVKFHFRTQQGIRNLTDQEAEAVVGKDRESHQNDLYNAIENGDFPKWTLYFQIMTEEQARNHRENPFDITKVWSYKEYPRIEVGVMELNRNPDNYFAQVEQAAFNPTNLVPGIGLSPDKLLQGRLFSYGDAQRYRLGVNHDLIPVNSPKVPVHAYHRDGLMRVDGNYGSVLSYTPNSYDEWLGQPEHRDPSLPLEGNMDRYEPKEDPTDDCFYQPGNLYRLITEDKKALLIENTARNMGPATENIKYRHAAHCYLADKDYGTRIAKAMSLNMDEVIRLSGLSHAERMKATSSV